MTYDNSILSLDTPDMSILDNNEAPVNTMRHVVKERFGDDFVTRLAYNLIETDKAVDILIAPANWGTTTLFTILKKAFPKLIGGIDATRAFNQTRRFSPLNHILTERKLCVIDMGGRENITPHDFNTLTDDTLTVEWKGKDAEHKRRTGTVLLIGHTWPNITESSQGIARRLRWAKVISTNCAELSQSEHDLLVSPPAVAYFRSLLYQRAKWLHHQGRRAELTYTEQNRDAVAMFLTEIGHPLQEETT